MHTGFLPPDGTEAALSPDQPAARTLSWLDPDDVSICTASFSKAEVDLVDRDHRFPRDWTLTLHYR